MSEWRVNNCPRCGGSLKRMSNEIKYCPFCGVELEEVIDTKKRIFNININKNINKKFRNVNVERNETEIARYKWGTICIIILFLVGIYLKSH